MNVKKTFGCDVYIRYSQLNFLLKSHSLKIKKSKTFVPSEASRSNLHCASRRWDWILWSGARSWFPWSCGVWIQWSVCTPTHTYHWVCPRSSLQYSFLSTAVGSQVSKCYIRVDDILTSITDEYAIDLLLLQAFFFFHVYAFQFLTGVFLFLTGNLHSFCFSLAHSELSVVFYEKVLLLAWGWVAWDAFIFIQVYSALNK